MPLVAAKCTQCGGQIEVDNTKEAGICMHCQTAFITEKAINNYNINYNTTNNTTIVKNIYGREKTEAEEYINNGDVFVNLGDLSKARAQYNQAVGADPSAYKGWFGLVKVQTENFSNLRDIEHFLPLKRAIAVACDKGKQEIRNQYVAYINKMEESYKLNVLPLESDVKKAVERIAELNKVADKHAEEYEKLQEQYNALGAFKLKEKSAIKKDMTSAQNIVINAEKEIEQIEDRNGSMNKFVLGNKAEIGLYYGVIGHPKAKEISEELFKYDTNMGTVLNQLAYCYKDGDNGINQDHMRAVNLFAKAAEYGNSDAQMQLGFYYHKGQGVPKDDLKAIDWFEKSAKNGHLKAIANLAIMYYKGNGVEQNFTKAFEWFTVGANQNAEGYYASAVLDCQNYLGVCYKNGEGVPQNYNKAFEWFSIAANAGDSYAAAHLGDCYNFARGTQKNWNAAVHWYVQAARKGHDGAQNYLRNNNLSW